MEHIIFSEKAFRQKHQSNTVTGTAKILIGKIRKHIEQDKCSCCAAALEEVLENG
ncbi:MAG TPA: hypothetical protein VHH33_06370 [Nitrososphaeraceae archaeon]|jgi:hypothetical protein|nr:hypothetical protein [Nitrososphaeraceae archaeon]